MAHRALTLGARALFALSLAACGEAPTTRSPHAGARAGAPSSHATQAPEYTRGGGAWGKFYSKRFQLTIPLPDGRAWSIDDHRAPELVAVHAATSSRLTVLVTREEDLMNRQRCEERARARGWVTEPALTTIDDQVHVGPGAFDSRVWTAIDPLKEGGGIEGHVYLFGALLRRCLFVHLTTSVPSANDDEALASRLAIGSRRIVKAITLDPPRTTDDAVVPRDAPAIRR